MSTERDALIFWLNSNYQVEALSDEVFKVNLLLDGNRTQMVFVAVWVDNFTVFSPIAAYDKTVALDILDYVAANGVMGLTVFGEFLCITNSSFNLNGPSLDDWISYMAETADDIERAITGGANIF
jgi:hypothetical protein